MLEVSFSVLRATSQLPHGSLVQSLPLPGAPALSPSTAALSRCLPWRPAHSPQPHPRVPSFQRAPERAQPGVAPRLATCRYSPKKKKRQKAFAKIMLNISHSFVCVCLSPLGLKNKNKITTIIITAKQ